MRSNHKLIILLFFAAGLLGTACKKEINKTPISSLTTGNFWKTADDAEAGLTGAYNSLYQQFYIWDYMTNGDAQSDNCYAGGNNSDNFAIDNYQLNALNGNVTRDWQGLYDGVVNANAVINNVPAINDPAWSGNTRKQQIIAEAKFLRALHYFYLVTTWGDVPLVLVNSSSSGPTQYPARTPAAQVWIQIEQDLLSADSSLLPASGSNPNTGRALQGSADALLAKVYAQQLKYDSCLTWCNKVLANSYYSLVGNYADLFDGNHKNTNESLFEIQHSTVSGTTDYGPELLLPYSLTNDNWAKFNIPTNDLIADYQSQNDTVREDASIYWSVAADSNGAIPPPYTKLPVPFSYKWKHADGYNSPDNQILIRLADIILLKAEALNQTGQTTQAIPLINQIRARVALPATTATSQSDVAAAVLNERRLELALEGWRWLDLLRAGSQYTINLMASQVDPYGKPLNYALTTNRLVWPVPQSERDLDVNLSQNTGY